MDAEKLALIDKLFVARREFVLADTARLIALQRIISDPRDSMLANLTAAALEAARAMTDADRAAFIAHAELEEKYPPRFLEEPVAGAWKPILEILAALVVSPPLEDPPT